MIEDSPFSYCNGALCAEALPLAEIAEDVDTPFYCTSLKRLQDNMRLLVSPFAGLDVLPLYEIKTNGNLAVVRTLADSGAGACVSTSGELERALEAGLKPDKIVFSGAGKTRDDIAASLLAGLHQLQADSLSELMLIDAVADVLGRTVPVTLKVHASFADGDTGRFGLDLDQLAEAMAFAFSRPTLDVKGLSLSLPADRREWATLSAACRDLAVLVRLIRSQGFEIQRLDLGAAAEIADASGAPISRTAFASLVRDSFDQLDCKLTFSAGASLVADAGVLVARVTHVRPSGGQKMTFIDTGKADLGEASLLKGWDIAGLRDAPGVTPESMRIVGPLGEVQDCLAEDCLLPPLAAGDLVAIMQAGAHGGAVSSAFRGRPLPPEIVVSGARYATARRRIAVAEQLGWEAIPEWMASGCAA